MHHLIVGGRYYDRPINHYGIAADQAAAAYNGGPCNYRNNDDAQERQENFNARMSGYTELVDCLENR